jgi:DMSO/TMAO reductase YedYZ molybdopterin-dependent catalytic subunit
MVRPPLHRLIAGGLRSTRLTSQLGLMLAVAFGACFATGLLSHAIQHPPAWFWWPARPVWLYRATQGLHVATGLATIPLLAAKLWSVYPRLFAWPPLRDVRHALERASILVLVAAALFQLVTGVLNIARWYALMPFGFTAAHHWIAWVAVGALLLHVAVKLPLVRQGLARAATEAAEGGDHPTPGGLSRRGLLVAVGATAATVTLATVGQTVRPLRGIAVLAPRRPDVGPQGLPVNASALATGVVADATDPAYQLLVLGPSGAVRLSLADLAALPQRVVSLPITCVEGWSADAVWSGVRVRDLVALVGATGDATVRVESLQRGGPYRSSVLAPPHARDEATLLALRLGGEPLHLDHGYPCRLIAPNRPGVLQTKWVAAVRVMAP